MPTEPPPIVKLLARAAAWQRELEQGVVKSRAAIAAREGVSAMRVGSILALLRLHPEIQAWIRSLPPGTPPRKVTERALRPITRMAAEAQLGTVARRWPSWKSARAERALRLTITDGDTADAGALDPARL